MSSHPISFCVYFEEMPEPLSEVWDMFATYLHEQVGIAPRWNVMQKKGVNRLKRSPGEVGALIDAEGLPGFLVDTNGLEKCYIQFSLRPDGGGLKHPDSVKAKGRVLWCSSEPGAKVPPSWFTLIEQIASRWPIYAGFQFDRLYYAWQSTAWVDHLGERFGPIPPTMGRLTVPSVDGIGPDRVKLDVSRNPGRGDSKCGQIRKVESEMWLGNAFWKYAPATKEEVLAADLFLSLRNYPEFVYFKAWPEPFTRPDGEQGRIQQKLWQLLFHEDCEWPPGSGGISDEPIYGPPELMPGYQPP